MFHLNGLHYKHYKYYKYYKLNCKLNCKLNYKLNYMEIINILIGIILLLTMVLILLLINNKKNNQYEQVEQSEDTYKDETKCKYVSSRGILKSCDIHSNKPISSIKKLIDYDFSNLVDNCTIYICTSAIPEFIKLLNSNKITVKFILVSGDADETVPDDILNKEEFNKFINNNLLIKWCAQNCILDHPKLYKIPIGLDYHSNIGGSIKNPIEHEKMMLEFRDKSLPFYEREIKCYSNFHFVMDSSKYGYDRKDAVEQIPKELMYYEPNRVKRNISFENQIKYAFVVSPHGNGLDCHRTWEALCIGCIPIVKTSPLDSLYEYLPVLIVKDWSDVSKELLENTIEEFKNKKFNYDKLLLKYWMTKIKSFK
jgi:hypothetical protein